MGASLNFRLLDAVDFSTATLGEKKANVNSNFAKLFSEPSNRLGYIFLDAEAYPRRPHRRRFDSPVQSRPHPSFGGCSPFPPARIFLTRFRTTIFFPSGAFSPAQACSVEAVATGVFYARNWARIAALVLASLIAFFLRIRRFRPHRHQLWHSVHGPRHRNPRKRAI